MKKLISMLVILLLPLSVHAVHCNGKIKGILTGNSYCGGDRVGFFFEGSPSYLCSSNKNMDAMLMAAFAAKIVISVRDGSWQSCESVSVASVPHHIWFGEI